MDRKISIHYFFHYMGTQSRCSEISVLNASAEAPFVFCGMSELSTVAFVCLFCFIFMLSSTVFAMCRDPFYIAKYFFILHKCVKTSAPRQRNQIFSEKSLYATKKTIVTSVRTHVVQSRACFYRNNPIPDSRLLAHGRDRHRRNSWNWTRESPTLWPSGLLLSYNSDVSSATRRQRTGRCARMRRPSLSRRLGAARNALSFVSSL